MNIMLRVARVSTHPVVVPVTFQGEEVAATVTETEVELTTEDVAHGSLTLRFRSAADRAFAARAFVPDSVVTWAVAKPA